MYVGGVFPFACGRPLRSAPSTRGVNVSPLIIFNLHHLHRFLCKKAIEIISIFPNSYRSAEAVSSAQTVLSLSLQQESIVSEQYYVYMAAPPAAVGDASAFTEDDLMRALLADETWINNADTDALEAAAAKRQGGGNNDDSVRYLRETVFPTLVPALHEMLQGLQRTLEKSIRNKNAIAVPVIAASSGASGASSSSQCPYRSIPLGEQRATGAETFGQAVTHTSELRRRTDFADRRTEGADAASVVDAIAALVEGGAGGSGDAAPFYGPTGRSHPIAFLAQLLMRNNVGPIADGQGGGGYAAHPYVAVESAAAAAGKPGYW